MSKILVIAGHGKNKDGSFDPGAKGYITKGEHKYYVEDFFPAVRKYLPDGHDVVLFTDYNVYDRQNIVALAKSYGTDTEVCEFHFDAIGSELASGGHVIIHADFKVDALDLKLRDWIKKHIGVRYSHRGEVGISGRDDLGNCNRCKNGGISYRLLELGFGTNKKDAETMTKKVDAIAKDFVLTICGKVKEAPKDNSNVDKKPAESKPTPKPTPPKPAPSKDVYAEKGTFYPNDTIIVRDQPSTKGEIVARYYQGESVTYHTVHLLNGYVWLQYLRSNGQQGYIPCRTYRNGKYGPLWGSIK